MENEGFALCGGFFLKCCLVFANLPVKASGRGEWGSVAGAYFCFSDLFLLHCVCFKFPEFSGLIFRVSKFEAFGFGGVAFRYSSIGKKTADANLFPLFLRFSRLFQKYSHMLPCWYRTLELKNTFRDSKLPFFPQNPPPFIA